MVSGLLCACLATCAQSTEVRLAPREQIKADGYPAILEEHTRRAHVYDLFEDMVHVRATYHSAAFRHAFAAGRSRFQGRSADAVERILTGKEPDDDPLNQVSDVMAPFEKNRPASFDPSSCETFFIAFYVSNQEYRALDERSSIWDLFLEVEGQPPVKPLRYERLRLDPSLTQIYPYLDKLDIPYVVYFPRADASGQHPIAPGRTFKLRFASKLATAILTWDPR